MTKQAVVHVLRVDSARDVLAGLACDHLEMDECHSGCGHFACPCGVSWDEGSEGPWEVENTGED